MFIYFIEHMTYFMEYWSTMSPEAHTSVHDSDSLNVLKSLNFPFNRQWSKSANSKQSSLHPFRSKVIHNSFNGSSC